MLFTWPLMAAIQEISARIGRVTGEGIAGNLRAHYPAWLLGSIVGLLLIANILNLGADLGAMGAATHLLIAGPAHLYVVAFAMGCALLEVFSRYERYASILKWTTLSLFAYVATALVVDVPWGQVAFTVIAKRMNSRIRALFVRPDPDAPAPEIIGVFSSEMIAAGIRRGDRARKRRGSNGRLKRSFSRRNVRIRA
jgi:Mn2+/Fe2+ NRAMP family transporter